MPPTRSSEPLIRAAVALIAESGLDGLTLRRVAGRAGVSRATAYREFGDKDGLVGAVARHEVRAMIVATLAAVDMGADPPAIVRCSALFALRYLRGHSAFTYIRDHEPHWLLNAALVVDDAPTDRRPGMNLVQAVAAMVAPVIAAPGGGLALRPLQSAEIMVRNILSHSLIEGSSLSDEQVAEAVARAII